MTLKEFINALEAFNCEAIADKEVFHYFAEKGYGYKEPVTKVSFDVINGNVVIYCGEIQKAYWEDKAFLKLDKKDEPKNTEEHEQK